MENTMVEYKNYPFDVCATAAARLVEDGCNVHQKFTCAKCGSRQTMEIPNRFFTEGTCEQCKYTTDIRKSGCNYMVDGPADVVMRHLTGSSTPPTPPTSTKIH
jgi:predicted nucleic-acid-binding Zn-ribbon protein